MTENEKIEPLEKIGKKVMDRYNKHPSGWRFLSDDHNNMLALGPKKGYRLKIMPITPTQTTGAGSRVKLKHRTREKLQKLPPWGLRPLSKTEVRKLLLAAIKDKKDTGKISSKFLKRDPIPFKESKEHNLLGPTASHQDLNSIIKGQEKLERKLKHKTYELFKKHYPQRAGKHTYT